MRKFHRFTEEEKEFLKQNVKGISNKELTERFNTQFGTELTIAQIKNAKKRCGITSGLTGWFEKGNTPMNKGLKWDEYMSKEGQQIALKTTFKKGSIPPNRREIGSQRVDRDGYLEVKIGNPGIWKHMHKIVWEETNGPVPKGHKIIFLDRNKRNFDISNLALVSNSEELIMNRNHLFSNNSECTKSGALIAKVIDTANKKVRKNEINK